MVNDILSILDSANTKLSNDKIAAMLGKDEAEIAEIIKGLEKENIIVGYKLNFRKFGASSLKLLLIISECKCHISDLLIVTFSPVRSRE